MKNILKYSLGIIVLIVASVGFFSCSDDVTDVSSAIYPSSVELVIPEELHPYIYYDSSLKVDVLPMVKGESVQLGYNIYPDDITFSDVIWTSNNEGNATVEDGKINAVSGDGVGYSIIQVAPDPFFAGSEIAAKIKVDISNTLIAARSITINSENDEVEIFAGETLQLSVSILPVDATYKTVKWSSSDELIATVNEKGIVTGQSSGETSANVTIMATSLDGAQTVGSKDITIKQIVVPEEVDIDQLYSVNNGYLFAISDKGITLNYTTIPAVSTKSLIEWTSSDESIATVDAGVVTFNQEGVFGDVTITATCPEGNSSSIKLRLEAGLIRELFHDPDTYTWYDAGQSKDGTSTSHVWEYGKVTVTTYKDSDTKQRADFKCHEPKTWLHTGNYPLFAIRIDDVMDLYDEVTARNINLDVSGNANGTPYSGNVGGDNNKWKYSYKCSDGSSVFVYDFSVQECKNGGLIPGNTVATFTTFQLKYADMQPLSRQITYNVYWVQTFKTLDDIEDYLTSEGLTFTK